MMRFWFAAVMMAPAAWAQFTLSVVTGNLEQPLPPAYEMARIYPGEPATARFRVRNTTGAQARVTVLALDGAGFTLAGAPALPAVVESSAAIEFRVEFRGAAIGSYSAVLYTEGVSVLLTALVQPRLNYTVDRQLLDAAPISFGTVERPGTAVRRVAIENRTALVLTIPLIAVEGAGFRLAGGSPSGAALKPLDTAGFDVLFAPAAAGASQGTLTIGDRSYALSGLAVDAPLPRPLVTVDLPSEQSAQQGTVTVRLESASRTSGEGVLTLEFVPASAGASDAAIAFGNGSRTMAFSVSPGDTEALTAPFQTGTTAGTLQFTASLGGVTEQQSLVIPARPVSIAKAEAVRTASGVELRIAGFDNTRSAGAVTYAFFNAAGIAIAPGNIQGDHTVDFTRFFQESGSGGNFLLRAAFPVTGDASSIAAFEAQFTTTGGTASTGRTPARL